MTRKHINDLGISIDYISTIDFTSKVEAFCDKKSPKSVQQHTFAQLFESFWQAHSPNFVGHINYIFWEP